MEYGLNIYAQNFNEGDFLKINYPYTYSYIGKKNVVFYFRNYDQKIREALFSNNDRNRWPFEIS